ncbi:Inner membrane protein forms channel for type IV secretion of T-DNA complex, VirB8 [Candidatus Burkholderia verschuerenii]|uniref:Inner membrane protein forms channel for type IV secretion of T-DNA complex, VirB8 n=1 Tax=Candidatus Burkholderia verschuerenii TaxID=242163 RepID=A0A0L0MGS7_9BURK|nr:type IV secretion system protein [Candidatus Burkholderia verschuerenii]KND61523.1 Inner membrane protein forms channel for type IV secretion of T-DNA complex, VirB8 [Candidatus Burkholderia verschuerenii]
MNLFARRARAAPAEAFMARPITADPETLQAYFSQVASYEASERARDRKAARAGFTVGAIGAAIGVMGVAAVLALTPLKTVIPLVFRVDRTTGAVERVYDVRGGKMEVGEAEKRFFLWQYVLHRQTYTAAEAESNFNAVALMSSPQVQQEYANGFKGTNPNSPQVLLGQDGTATVRWVSTSFLGPKLAQVRFMQFVSKAVAPLPAQRMVATIAFDFAPGQLSSSAINVNPLSFIVTSYRADMEAWQ